MGALIMLAQLVQSLFVSTSTKMWPSGTWANRPPNGNGGFYLVTDIGGGALFRDTGTRWVPVSACLTLAEQNTPVSIGATTNETVLHSVTIPAGLLGPNDRIRFFATGSVTGSTNSKNFRLRVGGITGIDGNSMGSRSITSASTVATMLFGGFVNKNSLSAQESLSSILVLGDTSVSLQASAVDFSTAQTIYLTGQKASAGETQTLNFIGWELIRGTT